MPAITNRHDLRPAVMTWRGNAYVSENAATSSLMEHDTRRTVPARDVAHETANRATYAGMPNRIAATCIAPPPPSRRIVDQNANLPREEPSKRTFLERIAGWEAAGRCVVLRCGKRRILPREVYAKLLAEDSAKGARRPASSVPLEDDPAADLLAMGYRAKAAGK